MPFVSQAQQGWAHAHPEEFGKKNLAEFDAATKAAIQAGAAVKLGCDHTHYPAHTQIAPEVLASLAGDLK